MPASKYTNPIKANKNIQYKWQYILKEIYHFLGGCADNKFCEKFHKLCEIITF